MSAVPDNIRPLDPLPAPEREETIDFLEYWRSITRRKWTILGLAFAVAVLTTLVVYSMRPVYRSTATLLVEFGKAKVVSIEEVYSGMSANREYYQTQVEILKSRELAKKVVEKLKLVEHLEFDPTQKSGFSLNWRDWIPASWLPETPAPTEDARTAAVVRGFMGNLEVQPVRNSQLVKISYEAHDRELAAKVPNALAEVYIESDLEAKVQMTQKASAWLTERMGGLRKKLEESERTFQQYREREKIVDAKKVELSGASKQLEEFAVSVVSARQRRAEAEHAYQQVQAALKAGAGLESVPAILRNAQFIRIKELEAEAGRKVSELTQRYGREHPKMVAAEADLRVAKDNARRQLDIVVATITKEFEVARANEQALERGLGQAKSDIQGINRKEFELGVLEREVTANRQIYDMFLARFKQTDVSGGLESTVARVVDPAVIPNVPAKPQKTRIVSIAFVLGLLGGVLLALLLERLDNTFKTSSDVESRLGIPVLGVVQRLKGGGKKDAPEREFLDDSQSVFSESVRTIRTGVMLSGLDAQKKIMMVTSSLPQEGKTTIVVNLAFALGHLKRVLIIDADMRRPSIGKILEQDASTPGLSHYVSGSAPISKCMFPVPNTHVHVMPAGVIPPNPLELLWSKRFGEVLTSLSETFDYIVIDSPPVQLVSDAIVLSKHVNEVIYVVKADDTPYQVARNGIRRLRGVGANVLGVVLNQLDMAKAEKYYGEYGYKYGYAYYGYGHPEKKKKKLAVS